MPRVLRVVLFAVVSTFCLGSSIVYLRVHRGVLEERLKAVPDTGAERLRKLREQFEAAGCDRDHLTEQTILRQDLPNLVCTMPGSEPGTIVVGAPIDFDADGPDTQWPTLALLPFLAESVGSVPHRLSLTFVAFSGHQHGSRGSSAYLRQLTGSQRREIRAMISLEGIGRTPPVYALSQEDIGLANWLTLASDTLRLHSVPMEITARNVDARLINGAPAFNPDEYLVDAREFQRAHIPAIALRSAPPSMIPAMRQWGAWTASGSGTSFDLNIYEQTYNQLSVYLLYLDSNLGTGHPVPPGTEVATTGTASIPATERRLPAVASAAMEASNAGRNSAPAATVAALPNSPLPPSRNDQQARPENIPVFHSEAKLVVIDVSVMDSQGAPVHGLKAGDFTLLEDGKRETIRVFEAHTSQAAPEVAVENPLPPRTFSNRVTAKADAPLNIFLFDLLNTPPQDQAYARAQMLQFLKSVPRGKPYALFVLGTRLRMVQGVTDDPQTLVSSAEKIVREASPLLTTELQQQQDQGVTEEVGRYAVADSMTGPSSGPSGHGVNLAAAFADNKPVIGFVGQRTAATANLYGIRNDERATFTIDAMTAIARAVAGYPGRKNLVWLSGSFEIRLRPSRSTILSAADRTTQAGAPVTDLTTTSFSYQEVIRRLTTVMATSRIAIYPIDVRGLRTEGVDIGVGAEQSRSFVDPSSTDASNFMLMNQSDTRFGERTSMFELADQTGGRFFINNDVRGSIVRSLEEGSNYYTLAYTPEKSDSDKGFRRVEIKLNRVSVKLAYRPGYYPTRPQDAVEQSGAHLLAAAMQPGLPESTMLFVTARVQPPDATGKALRIDYSIDFKGLNFTDIGDNRKRALIDCMAVALDAHGEIVGQVGNTMDAALPPQEYQALQNTGLPLHQELVLPPGTYDLRLGVLDRTSQKIGTVSVPVVIAAEKAEK
ncbi:MAG: VWA domain-containing protein [Terriglobales bacterium]